MIPIAGRSTAARVAAVDLGCNKFYSSWHFSQCAGLGKMNIETSRLVFLHFEAPHRFCHYPVEISLSHVNFGRGCILSARRRKQPTARGRRVRDCPLCPRRLTTHKKKRMDFNGLVCMDLYNIIMISQWRIASYISWYNIDEHIDEYCNISPAPTLQARWRVTLQTLKRSSA